MINPLLKIIKFVGSQKKLADQLGIKQQSVSDWLSRGIPPRRVPQLVKLMNGKISPQELRPDIYDIDI
jgi:DNA-binding transcriptional regulator YdaS (Cro superfamily)